MLKNDYILKNDENIFKSQVVDSYLSINTAGNIYFDVYISGLTEGTSINMFYKTPTATIKKTCSNSGNAYFTFLATNETSYKNIYFCGDLDSITCVQPRTQCVDGKYTGDFVKFINQFPNLTSINMAYREFDFNQNISYSEIPRNVTSFCLYDCGIAGDIATITNIGNVKCWCLNQTRSLTGNFHDINFNGNLECTTFYSDTNLCVNLECLVNNNSNYIYSYVYYTPSILCADNMDMSNLKYINWYLPYPTSVKGEFDNWIFNTGLTNLYLSTSICGNVTTWDISNTNIQGFSLCATNSQNVYGDMSGWVLPDTLTAFNLGSLNNVTCLPIDYSNTQLSSMYIYYLLKLSGDVTTFIFPTGHSISFGAYYTSLSGNLENFSHILTGSTNISLSRSCFSGNLSGITINPAATNISLDNNYLTGKVNDFNFPTTLNYLYLCGNRDICLDLTSSFDTKNLVALNLSCISGVTGSFSNLTVGNNLRQLSFNNTNISPDINNLNLNQICTLCFYSSSLSTDITNMFTGSTNVYCLYLGGNSNLSGDTTNWSVDNMCILCLSSTSLSGRLKHSNPLCINVSYSDINSCINADWDLTSRGACIQAYVSCIQGDLSTINLNYSTICTFNMWANPYLSGATGFANKVFDERKSFLKSWVNLNWGSIADNVTGTSETLGDLGTYAGHQWDLTETEVNNLALGLDYDGLGSNTCWDPKQKMYWVKNACIGSSSTTKRYGNLNINYS